MSLQYNNKSVIDIKYNDKSVKSIYRGDNLVYSSGKVMYYVSNIKNDEWFMVGNGGYDNASVTLSTVQSTDEWNAPGEFYYDYSYGMMLLPALHKILGNKTSGKVSGFKIEFNNLTKKSNIISNKLALYYKYLPDDEYPMMLISDSSNIVNIPSSVTADNLQAGWGSVHLGLIEPYYKGAKMLCVVSDWLSDGIDVLYTYYFNTNLSEDEKYEFIITA